MTRPRSIPLDDIFPGDVITVFSTSPICITSGRSIEHGWRSAARVGNRHS